MKKKLAFWLLVFSASALLNSACKKDAANNDLDEDTPYALDQARLEQTFNDVQNIADEAATSGATANFKTTNGSALGGCATVTRDTISVPHTVTIDFGNTNCLCNDGRYRRGEIIVSYMGRYRDSGHVHTITFNSYFVNDHQVLGTKSVTNMGKNPSGQTYFSISVNGAIVAPNGTDTLSWAGTKMRTWIAGENTLMRSDDVFEITSSGTVTRPNNHSFSINTITPLTVAVSCNWIEQGVVQLTPIVPANQATRSIDYGNGNCDNQAIVTIGSKSKTITLP